MTVKEVLKLAAGNIGREDLINSISNATATSINSSSDTNTDIKTLLRCFNIVENEIALDYYPLVKEETLPFSDGTIVYTRFSRAPVNVQKAVCNGRLARFSMRPDCVCFSDEKAGEAVVTYAYLPTEKNITGEPEVCSKISARLMACGIAGEFLLARGETGRSAMWSRRFYDALRAAGLMRRTLHVRSRRWA